MGTMIFHQVDGSFVIPHPMKSFDAFRQWTHSPDFPSTGRIDWIGSRLEVDMSPESLYSHGAVKVEIVRFLAEIAKRNATGEVYSDSTRVVSRPTGLSAEPDVVFIRFESLKTGKVARSPKAGRSKDFVEIVGPIDLAVEIISDSSVEKDTVELAGAYFAAGFKEYWLIDARSETLLFSIMSRGDKAFIAEPGDVQTSGVLGLKLALVRSKSPLGDPQYDMEVR